MYKPLIRIEELNEAGTNFKFIFLEGGGEVFFTVEDVNNVYHAKNKMLKWYRDNWPFQMQPTVPDNWEELIVPYGDRSPVVKETPVKTVYELMIELADVEFRARFIGMTLIGMIHVAQEVAKYQQCDVHILEDDKQVATVDAYGDVSE